MKLALLFTIALFTVLVYDYVAASISLRTGLHYGLFSIGSFVIYFLFGFLIARKFKWVWAATAGAAMGLVDASVGWAISWQMGPGKPPIEMSPVLIGATIVFVVFTATIIGLLGGLLGTVTKRDA